MKEIDFTNTSYQIVRKRNCNKQLYEFVICGKKYYKYNHIHIFINIYHKKKPMKAMHFA